MNIIQKLLNIINNILNRDFTSAGRDSQSSSRNQNKRSTKYLPTIIVVGFLAVIGFTSIFTVEASEQSIILLLGKYNRTVGPGLQFKLPFAIERNYNVPIQIVQKNSFGFRVAEAGIVSQRAPGDFTNESTMLTGDLNIANVEWIIQYRITDPYAWLFNVENKEKTIRDISISVVNQLVGDYYITDVLGVAKTVIEEDAQVLMNEFFSHYILGITVTAVRLQNVVPPEGRVQDAFEDVNKAEQDRNRLINEGKEEYNKEIPKSRGQAEQLIELAHGYATERINQANGDVARFKAVLQEYSKNPKVTRDRLYYETIETLLNSDQTGNTQFIDGKFSNLVPFLPLNQNAPIKQQPAQ